MLWIQGKPLPLGVTNTGKRTNFAIAVPAGSSCELLLYEPNKKEPFLTCEFKENIAVGEVRCMAIDGLEKRGYEYIYRIDGKYCVDPYAKKIVGREKWGDHGDVSDGEIRGVLMYDDYEWKDQWPLNLPMHEIVAYGLHIRGFTKHSSSKVKSKNKGTFMGVVEKLPYCLELGINQIHCMPVYEFDECGKTHTNYWGYGPGYYFAPKSAYAASGDGVRELREMVEACHMAGIEVVLEMPFDYGTPNYLMEDCLRHYVMNYHIDGFTVNPSIAPMEAIYKDPVLKNTKIFTHRDDFQNVMRRFLKGDEGMVSGVMHWQKYHDERSCNYITSQNGFTLNDLVSYDSKHNEDNGEHNQDGQDYNFSWNCGAEGPSRRKTVNELRKNQIRNAWLLLLLAQGTPCILAGDEFGNTQKGNNNAYCQDNAVSWLDWNCLKKQQDNFLFVKELIALRRKHPVFRQKELLRGMDVMRCGIPDVSYHGEYAWRIPDEVSSRQLGIFYCGAVSGDDEWFVIYNMHWLEHTFALPALPGKKKWHVIISTKEGILKEPKVLANQHDIKVKERTILVLTGR